MTDSGRNTYMEDEILVLKDRVKYLEDTLVWVVDTLKDNLDRILEVRESIGMLLPEIDVLDTFTGVDEDTKALVVHKLMNKRNLADVLEEVAPDEGSFDTDEAEDLTKAKLYYRLGSFHENMSKFYAKDGKTDDANEEAALMKSCNDTGDAIETRYGYRA